MSTKKERVRIIVQEFSKALPTETKAIVHLLLARFYQLLDNATESDIDALIHLVNTKITYIETGKWPPE